MTNKSVEERAEEIRDRCSTHWRFISSASQKEWDKRFEEQSARIVRLNHKIFGNNK